MLLAGVVVGREANWWVSMGLIFVELHARECIGEFYDRAGVAGKVSLISIRSMQGGCSF